MATRRKRRKQAAEVDPLGGFSLEELMGLDPVVEVERKPNVLARLIAAPFKLVGAVMGLPFRILRALMPRRKRPE